jgi:hypothetical protein
MGFTGQYKTFGQFVWGEQRRSLILYIHRKIRRYDVYVGEDELFLPVLEFKLNEKPIGDMP